MSEDEKGRLQRRLDREIRAREESENLLEEKSAALFNAVEELEKEAERGRQFLVAFAAAQDGLLIADEERSIVFSNNAFGAMFEFNDSELKGKVFDMLYPELTRARLRNEIIPLLKSSGSWSGELIGLSKTGKNVEQEITLSLLPNGGLVCASRNVEKRKARERDTTALSSYLKNAERDAALFTLSSSIAHDFNNILFAIEGHSHLLKAKLEPGSGESDLTNRIISSTHVALEAVDSLRKFSFANTGNDVPFDLVDLARQTIGIVEPLRPPAVSVEVDFPPQAQVMGNEVLISRCLINLLINAFEALQGSGAVHLRILSAPSTPLSEYSVKKSIGLQLALLDWVIEIEDRGHGIPVEKIDHILEPHFSTKESQDGTGLGLFSLMLLVESAKIGATIESTEGIGSRFSISFSKPKLVVAGSPVKSMNNCLNILLVDDDVAVGGLIRSSLEELGHLVTYESCPSIALTAMNDRNLSFDLLMTDIAMPVMRGNVLAQKSKAIRPELICIGFSGQAAFIHPDPVFQEFLQKPMKSKDLDEAIQRVMAQRASK